MTDSFIDPNSEFAGAAGTSLPIGMIKRNTLAAAASSALSRSRGIPRQYRSAEIQFLEDIPYVVMGSLAAKDIKLTHRTIEAAIDMLLPPAHRIDREINPRLSPDVREEPVAAPPSQGSSLADARQDDGERRLLAYLRESESQKAPIRAALVDGFRGPLEMPPECSADDVLRAFETKFIGALRAQLEIGFSGITTDKDHIFWADENLLAEEIYGANKTLFEQTARMIAVLSFREDDLGERRPARLQQGRAKPSPE